METNPPCPCSGGSGKRNEERWSAVAQWLQRYFVIGSSNILDSSKGIAHQAKKGRSWTEEEIL